MDAQGPSQSATPGEVWRVREIMDKRQPRSWLLLLTTFTAVLALALALSLIFFNAKFLEIELLKQARADLTQREADLKACKARIETVKPISTHTDPVSALKDVPSQQLVLILLLQKIEKESGTAKGQATSPEKGASGSSSGGQDVLKSLANAVTAFVNLGLIGVEQGKSLKDELQKRALEVGGNLTLELGRAIIAELFAKEAKNNPSPNALNNFQFASQTGLTVNLTCNTPPAARPVVVSKPKPPAQGCACGPQATTVCNCARATGTP